LAAILAIGKPVALRRERRGARHARVHLDDDHAAVLRVDRELDVGAARLDADLADAPRARRRASAGIRLSVSVCAGATVIESPVWTPIGSMFSIEQMMTHVVGAVAHRPPVSYSFQPSTRLLDEHLVTSGESVECRREQISFELLAGCRRCRRPCRRA
jgi:hypothetical protein